jgi:hypothetical protein
MEKQFLMAGNLHLDAIWQLKASGAFRGFANVETLRPEELTARRHNMASSYTFSGRSLSATSYR